LIVGLIIWRFFFSVLFLTFLVVADGIFVVSSVLSKTPSLMDTKKINKTECESGLFFPLSAEGEKKERNEEQK